MSLKSIGYAAFVHVTTLVSAFAYAEAGHRIIGGIADEILAGKPGGAALKQLLGPVTLERASTIPDELRGEDRSRGSFKLPENPQLEMELLAFRTANPPSGDDQDHMPPSHHWFHYTDVPLQASDYTDTKVGTSKWDVVNMIDYCQRVIAGEEKPDNERKITPAVAVVLLSHYVGDIHQPLHVGAAFLDKQGNLLDPNQHPDALQTRGGNDINFGASNLHAYWDYDSVESAMAYQRRIQDREVESFRPHDWAVQLAGKEPADWKSDASLKPDQWAKTWANEMLPLAVEAHSRLRILPQEEFDNRSGKPVMAWIAVEKPHPGKSGYAVFASKTVEVQLNKAGWRLAALLEASFPRK